jgi:YaiO family outer membrane protein
MKTCGLYIVSVCWLLLLLPLSVAAQTAAARPSEAPPAATPTPNAKTDPTDEAKQTDPELQVELGASYEGLSNGNPDWQSYFLNFNRKFASGQTLYGTAAVVRRFGLTDTYLTAALVQPFGESRHWSATFEVSGSPRHQVLPQFSFYGQLERNFGGGWVGHAGLRHSRYSENDLKHVKRTNDVNLGVFGAERYFKQYRAAYTLYVAHLSGVGTSASHVFQGNYYYGQRNSIGIGGAFGEEVESLGGGRLLRTAVQDLSLNGRHWAGEKWGVSYGAWWHRQGKLYTRSGAQIALLRRF